MKSLHSRVSEKVVSTEAADNFYSSHNNLSIFDTLQSLQQTWTWRPRTAFHCGVSKISTFYALNEYKTDYDCEIYLSYYEYDGFD